MGPREEAAAPSPGHPRLLLDPTAPGPTPRSEHRTSLLSVSPALPRACPREHLAGALLRPNWRQGLVGLRAPRRHGGLTPLHRSETPAPGLVRRGHRPPLLLPLP